ncbi:MAG: hypothetical protein JNL80_01355 [Phycisphaerae bacterium]|jgi:hypothetical protein|nr:hypothetical protein [Phycisphaerae bacterium]
MTTTKTILASTLTLTLAAALAPASGAGANSQTATSGSKPSPTVVSPDQKAAPKAQGLSDTALPAIPATPAGITELIEVREFRITEAYEHRHSKEKPSVTAGYLMVIRAPSEYLAPRQVEMPVLMVGSMPVEPMNVGFASGQLIAIVPSATDAQGKLMLDLAKAPIYFAPPALPEQIDEAFGRQVLGLATRSGIVAQSADALARARAAGGATVEVADRDALNKIAGALVRTYAADEADVADALEGKTDSTPRVVKP